MFNPIKPYYDLPKLPPSNSIETLGLFKALVPSSEALAKLSATAEHLPNEAALYQSVILLEAKASSEIEQIVTTDGDLFSSESSSQAIDPLTKEVHRYAEAMNLGWGNDRPLCTPLVEQICSVIKGYEVTVRKVPGTSLKRPSTGEIVYTPPDGETLLRDFLDNLFAWMNADNDIHPIIKAAIAHYQFESIHPFTDGNGRTGRIMVVLYLIEQKLLNTPALFLSGEILKDRESYYSLLQTTRETEDFIPYLKWFVKLVHRASIQSTTRANNVREEMQRVKQELRSANTNIYSQDLVNLLFKGPLIFAHQLVKAGIAGSLSTAHTYLKELESMSIVIRSDRRYNRKVGYISNRLLDALSGEIDLS
jgi:Fic family protein